MTDAEVKALTHVLWGACGMVVTLYVILLALDAFLGEATKQRLKDKTLRFWVWLDDAKKAPIRTWIRRHFWWFATPAIAAQIILMAYISQSTPFPKSVGDAVSVFSFLVLPSVFALLLGLLAIRLILSARTWWLSLLWLVLFLAVAYLPLILIVQALPYVQDLLPQLALQPLSSRPWLLAMLFVVGMVVGVGFGAALLVFCISAATGWLAIYGLTVLLHVTEYVVRRLAESKQALAALAGILGAVALLLQWAITPLP